MIACISIVVGVSALMFYIAKEETTNVPKYVLSYAENQGPDHPAAKGAYYFAEAVEKETNGAIKIVVKTQGELGTETEVLKQLRYGGIDFARSSLAPMEQSIPEVGLLQLPYLYEDAEEMWQWLDGELGSTFIQMIDKTGMKALSWYDAGVRNIYNDQGPIETLEDMKGLKLRIQESEAMMRTIEALGASPIKMSYETVYDKLQQEEIDGAENNWSSYLGMAHYVVAEYITKTEHVRIPEVQLCSGITWAKFTEEEKEMIMKCAQASAEYERLLWQEEEEKAQQRLEDLGVEITVLSKEEQQKFKDAVQVVYELYAEEFKSLEDMFKK